MSEQEKRPFDSAEPIGIQLFSSKRLDDPLQRTSEHVLERQHVRKPIYDCAFCRVIFSAWSSRHDRIKALPISST